jgi:hypothetical protein
MMKKISSKQEEMKAEKPADVNDIKIDSKSSDKSGRRGKKDRKSRKDVKKENKSDMDESKAAKIEPEADADEEV